MTRTWVIELLLLAIIGVACVARADILPPPPERPNYDENNVDVHTRQFRFSHAGVSIGPSDHHGLAFIHHFSNDTWRHSYSSGLRCHIDHYSLPTVTIEASLGNFSESFEGYATGTGSYFDCQSYIRKDGTRAQFDHQVYAFSAEDNGIDETYNVVTNVEHPDGLRVTYHYKDFAGGFLDTRLQDTRLQSVTTNTGYQLKFVYDSNNMGSIEDLEAWRSLNKVIAINNAVEYCDPDADICSLTNVWPEANYSRSGMHFYLTDSGGFQTRFTNNFASHFFAIKTPDSSTDNRVYNVTHYRYRMLYGTQVGLSDYVFGVNQAIIDGQTTGYSNSDSVSTKKTTVTAVRPLSDTRQYVSGFDGFGVLSYTDALTRPTSFTYDELGHFRTATRPEGNVSSFVLDGRGNITASTLIPKPGSGQAAITESWIFPTCGVELSEMKTCNQPISHTDPRGAVTEYTYDSASGGRKSETLPPPTPGAARPTRRFEYAPRSAWIKNSAGAYVQADTPVYLLTEERTCRSSATVDGECSAVNDEVLTTYEYGPNSGPNNLLLRGKVVSFDGESRRTCYGYDKFGNKVSETLPRAGLSSCP